MTIETSSIARSRRRISIGALVAVGALVAACGGTTGSAGVSSPSAAGAAKSTVNVTLQEFAVIPDAASVPAGTVNFVVKNTGPEDVHELVVIKTDLAADALPVDKDGKVTEDVEGITLIGEVEDIEVGASKEAALELTAGKYVLLCNILQTEPDGSLEAHYKVGMRTAFEVK
jgi:uncharacterized cupredoxin-like copper-binding protein